MTTSTPKACTDETTLAECPPGLFRFGGTLGFKSEYGADAYVVESGEFFWGGASTHKDRAALIVRPVTVEADELRDALKLAIGHLEHMAAWIGAANLGAAKGRYSFEALGEDIAHIRAPLAE